MEVLVCHRQRALVQLGRLHAEQHGVRVRVAHRPKDVLPMARAQRPNLIVLGSDLKDPSTEELVSSLQAEPTLAGVEVVVTKAGLPDLGTALRKFRGPIS